MNKTVYLVLIICCSFSNIPALDLTSSEAEQLAINHSLLLKKSQAESDAYYANLNAAKAERYPTVSLESKALYNSNTSSLDLQLPGFNLQKEIGQHQVYQNDLRISLPIYTGGKISSAINLAEANYQLNKALLQKSNNEIRYLAKQEYLKLFKAENMINVAKSSIKRTELVKKDIQSLFDAGAADSVDVYEIEFSYNNALLYLKQAENSRRSQEIILSLLLGLKSDEPIKITTKLEKPELSKNLSLPIDDNKPELQAARSYISLSKSRLDLNRSSYAPNISLIGGYSYGKPNISPFEDAFNSNFTIGAVLNWSFNLGGKTSSQVSMSEYLVQAGTFEYDKTYEEIQRQSQLAYENLKLTYTNYETAVKNYQITENNFRLAKIKNQEGILSTNHLLDIESKLSQAEAMLYSTEADYYLILNQYQYITGYNTMKEGH